MSDIKLFRTLGDQVHELEGHSVAVEKSLQDLVERHLETFIGVRFLASEYSTGPKHRGRIDTLGLDENGYPVIIEYKRALNENVINQGLFYLDWLLDHKAEFQLLVLKQLGSKAADTIEWSSPRLLCIAGDYTRYDEHAVQQINRNIELIRYRRYGDEFVLFELAGATSASAITVPTVDGKTTKTRYKTVGDYLAQAGPDLTDRYESLRAFLLALGNDVQEKTLKYYVAFKRIKNFACIEVHPQSGELLVFLKVDPDSVELKDGFTRDVRTIGHFGTGDLEVRLRSEADFERAKPLLLQSYEAS